MMPPQEDEQKDGWGTFRKPDRDQFWYRVEPEVVSNEIHPDDVLEKHQREDRPGGDWCPTARVNAQLRPRTPA